MPDKPKKRPEQTGAWVDPLRLIKKAMGPDMIQSYVMSCLEVRDIIEGKVFLDIGGHAGGVASYAAMKARCSLVINILRSELAATFNEYSKPDHLDLTQGDAQNLPLKSNSIDIALTAHTLEHVPDYRTAVGEIKRALKDNGELIVILPNANVISGYNLMNFKEIIRILRGKRRLAFENVKPYAAASTDGPTYHGWENAFDTPFFSQYLQSEGFTILNTKQGFLIASSLLCQLYAIPNLLVKLARRLLSKLPTRLPWRSIDALAQLKEGRPVFVEQHSSTSVRLVRKVITLPWYFMAKMHRLYLLTDSIERRLLPRREGGVFLIHARKG